MYSQSDIYDGILGPAPDSDSSRYPGYYGFYANYGYLLPSNIHSPIAASPIRKKATSRDRSKNKDKMSVSGTSKPPEASPTTHHNEAAAPSPKSPADGIGETVEAAAKATPTCEPSQPSPKMPEPEAENCISESLALADILMKNFRSLECETCGQHFGYESRRSKSRPTQSGMVVCSLKCAAILMEKSKDHHHTNEKPNNVDVACAPVVQIKISTIQSPPLASAAAPAPPAIATTGKPKPTEPVAASALNSRGVSISNSDSVSSSVGNTNKEFMTKTSLVEKSKPKQQQQRRRNLRPHLQNETKQRPPVPVPDFANLKHKNIIEKDPLPTQSQIRPPSKPLPLRPPVEEPSFSRRPTAR